MNIVVGHTFLKQYLKFWGKGAPHIGDFCLMLKQQVLTNTIYLNRPYAKLKFSYQNKAIRMIVKIDQETIVPFFISDKNDKLYGENMNRENIKMIIAVVEDRLATDINSGEIVVYKY